MIILTLGNTEAWKTVGIILEAEKLGSLAYRISVKRHQNIKIKSIRKITLWVTEGKSWVEQNILNVPILRYLIATKLQRGKAAYLAIEPFT